MYDVRALAHYMNCSAFEIIERIRSKRMTGDDYQRFLICAQADHAVDEQRRKERERGR